MREKAITSSRKKYALPRSEIEAMLWKRAESESDVPQPAERREDGGKRQSPQKVQSVLEDPKPAIAELPVTIEQKPEVPIAAPSPLPATTIAAQVSPPVIGEATPPSQDKGIGGHQHNLIRERIELVGRQLGYSTSRESPLGSGGKVDVVLENSQRAIACEIAITTTIDHEVGNVSKCLKAGFKHVAVISSNMDRLEKIKIAVIAALSAQETTHVGYFLPEQFLGQLQELATKETMIESTSTPTETQIGKYKVRRTFPKLTPEEKKQREAAGIQMLAKTMGSKF
jgi:hypothetical protein